MTPSDTTGTRPARPVRPPIVVGVDGSDPALEAARWAAREARARGLPLRLAHACSLPPVRYPVDARAEQQWIDAMTAHGERILAEAAAAAHAVEPAAEVEVDQRLGRPVDILVAESERARMLVLGTRGLGGFQGLLVGSVSTAVAAHAHGPVVVVREAVDRPSAAPVVVGVDGSPASEAAVAFAFEQAALHGAPLRAVHTWLDISYTGGWVALPALVDWDAVAEEERLLLDQRMAGWQEKYPEVAVERVVVRDRPVRALLDHAATAQLVVVGSRGHNALVGMGLGSTSQALAHHCPCPVAVVRPQRNET